MSKIISIIIVIVVLLGGWYLLKSNNKESPNTQNEETMITTPVENEIKITPIEHATLMLEWGGKVFLTDPVGDLDKFYGLPDPDYILITDIHQDHLDPAALRVVLRDKTKIFGPQAVKDEITSKHEILGKYDGFWILFNGETPHDGDFTIEAIPMYNLPEDPKAYHTKGRGNGYVIERQGKRIYIAGDTEDIPEMRTLKNIDHAFIPMNLPYTMTVEQAASAVLEFKPKVVTPYHYRGQEGLSDINKFRDLVNAGDSEIEVDIMNFYPNGTE